MGRQDARDCGTSGLASWGARPGGGGSPRRGNPAMGEGRGAVGPLLLLVGTLSTGSLAFPPRPLPSPLWPTRTASGRKLPGRKVSEGTSTSRRGAALGARRHRLYQAGRTSMATPYLFACSKHIPSMFLGCSLLVSSLLVFAAPQLRRGQLSAVRPRLRTAHSRLSHFDTDAGRNVKVTGICSHQPRAMACRQTPSARK
jgi:hypothetical protein